MSSLRFPIVKCKLLFTFFIVFFYFSSHTTLYSQCEVNAGSDQTICEGESVTLGGNPVLGAGFGNNPTFEWSNGDMGNLTPTVSPNSTTIYTVNVENSGACQTGNYLDQITITVISAELSGAQLSTFNGEFYFVQCTTGGANGLIFVSNAVDPSLNNLISNYVINWGDGSPDFTTTSDSWASQNHEYAPGIYTLTYTITGPNNCTTSRTYQVFVGDSSAIGLGSPGNTQGCAPITLTFPILNTGNNVPGTIYNVVFSDGSPTITFNHPAPANVTHTFQQSSCGESVQNGSVIEQNAFGVTIQAVNPCGSSSATVAPIRLSEPPSASFTANPTTVCVNQTSTITSTADLGSNVTVSTCNSNAVLYWTVSPEVGWVTTGTLGSSNGFAPVNYTGWTPGSNTLPLTFSQPGTYSITQHIANGCGEDTYTEVICVIPTPICAFTLTPTSGCSVLNVNSSNTSQPPSCNAVPLDLQYTWTVSSPSGGNGSSTISSPTAQSPTFTFTNSGTTNITFTVTLTVSPINPQTGLPMSCTTTCTQTVTVFPAPSLAPPSAAQVSCGPFDPSPFTLIFFGGGVNPQFQWYSTTNPTNPGSTGNPGTFIAGANTSTYNPPVVSETIYYFCIVTYSGAPNCATYQSGLYQAIVNLLPSVNAGSDQLICSTSIVNLSAIGSGGTAPLSYAWTPAGSLSNATIANPVASPSATTSYNVTVIDANGCTATDALLVTVNTDIVAEASGPYAVCGEAPIALNAIANGAGQWTGGTGTFSNATSVSSTYTPVPGEVGTTVNLTWTTNDPDGSGPCNSATDQATVTISIPAFFEPLTPFTICSNSSVSLQVNTLPATGTWSGGGGFFANISSSATIYTPGSIDVANPNLNLVWTTSDPDGTGPCLPITVNQPLDVIGTSIAEASGPYNICGAAAVTLGAIANGAGQWTGGAGTFSDATSVSSTYTPVSGEVGTTVNLTWTTNDPDGSGPCNSATDQATVTVSTPASFTPLTPLTICSSSAASLQVTTTPATGSWSGGGGTFDNANSSTTVYTPGGNDAGNANLNLVWTTTDPDGAGPCPSISVNQPLDVIGTATAEAAGPYSVCGAAAITLSASANGAGQWTGGAGTFANATLVNTTYTPTSNEIGTSVTLTWTTNDPDGAGPCIPATDQASLVVEECTSEIFGCMDVLACNFNPDATVSDESCIFPIEPYLDCLGQCLNDSDSDGICDEIEIGGCTNPTACNYNSEATDEDGSCILFTEGIIAGSITPDAFSSSSYTYTPTYTSSTIEWVVSNGVVTSGQGTAEIQIQWAQEGMGSVQVQEIYSANCAGSLLQIDVVVIPTLVDELSDVSISVFPNPTSDILNIKSETNLVGSNWTLLDITGREVLSGVCLSDYERIDLKFCSPGQYILRITQPGIVKNFPIIYSGRISE